MQTNNTKIIIKKYPNRRMYNTHTSSYTTIEALHELVRQQAEFIVVDAQTGDDVTKQVLMQIIFDQEEQGYGVLSADALRQIIQFYNYHLAQNSLQQYLENFTTFLNDNPQQCAAEQGGEAYSPVSFFEDLTKQNMNMFKTVMSSFYDSFKEKEEEKL